MNIPTLLTWARIAALPFFIALWALYPKNINDLNVYSAHLINTLMMLLFVIVAITDWLDGYLARKLQQISSFGAFLDPVADKLIVTATLLILLNLERISLIITLVIIGRELAISALREWMALIGRSKNVAVHSLGKLKTIAQMIAIPMLLFYQDLYVGTYNGSEFYLPIVEIGRYCLYLATILTIWSMIYYLKQAYPLIKDQMN